MTTTECHCNSGQNNHYGYEAVMKTVEFLRKKAGLREPTVGLICGTGFGSVADRLENRMKIPYDDVPGFPVSAVKGHSGNLIFGTFGNKEMVCMQGRCHPYEGYPLSQLVFPVRVMKFLGVKTVFLTNAAGAVNPEFRVGDLMIINDQIFLLGLGGKSPLMGLNDERFGPRFPATNDLFDKEIRNLAKEVGEKQRVTKVLREGVYAMTGGPQFESPAEARYLRNIGADALGMSTCHEAIAAVHCGMKVFGISLITNKVVTDPHEKEGATHEAVVEMGHKRAEMASAFLAEIVESLEHN